jgi:hypothetical protein
MKIKDENSKEEITEMKVHLHFQEKNRKKIKKHPYRSRSDSEFFKAIRKDEYTKQKQGQESDKCFLCGKQGHYSKNSPERKYSMLHQHGLFVGHAGEDNVYMLVEEIKQVHKTNRDWQHVSSESNETRSDDDDSKPSAVRHLDSNNNGNNQGSNLKDLKWRRS